MNLYIIHYSCATITGQRCIMRDYVVADNSDEALLFFKLHELIRNEKRKNKLQLRTIDCIEFVERVIK